MDYKKKYPKYRIIHCANGYVIEIKKSFFDSWTPFEFDIRKDSIYKRFQELIDKQYYLEFDL